MIAFKICNFRRTSFNISHFRLLRLFTFIGLHITYIYAYEEKSHNKGFVVFSSVNDVETALNQHNTATQGISIQLRRSSNEQLNRCLCEDNLRALLIFDEAESLLTETPSASTLSLDSEKLIELRNNTAKENTRRRATEAKASSKPSTDLSKETNRIVARGLPWKVTEDDILEFFQGVNILNGKKGIQFRRCGVRGAMEAHFEVVSANDRVAALKRRGQLMDNRRVDGELNVWTLSE